MGFRQGAVENMVSPSPTFWAGKRVLVTGHTGFKGAWLGLWLNQLGARVCGVALQPDTEPNLFSLLDLEEAIEHAIADVRDADAVHRILDRTRPDIVMHLAAQALVRRSYTQPIATFATNIMGTANVLEAVRQSPSVKAVVIVTTDKCYENRETEAPYRESDALGGRDPYSGSKACAEIVTAAYRDSFLASRGVAVGSVRAGNVIGGGDWAEDRLLPDCIRAFQDGRKVAIRNPHAVRPWQHVLDPLAGYLLLAEHLHDADLKCASAFNFGPDRDDARPVSWLVAESARLWGEGAAWEADLREQPHEAQLLTLNAYKARELLDWRPRLRLTQGLAWTVEWYRAVAHGAAAREETVSQIERYSSLRAVSQ